MFVGKACKCNYWPRRTFKKEQLKMKTFFRDEGCILWKGRRKLVVFETGLWSRWKRNPLTFQINPPDNLRPPPEGPRFKRKRTLGTWAPPRRKEPSQSVAPEFRQVPIIKYLSYLSLGEYISPNVQYSVTRLIKTEKQFTFPSETFRNYELKLLALSKLSNSKNI